MSSYRTSNPAVVVLVVGFALGACSHAQPNYCPTATDHNCLELDASLQTACTGDPDCGGANAVCDVTGAHVCVTCTSAKPAACTGTTPVCSADHACQGCTANAQCGSEACLPDGSCGEDGSVAYVDPGGTDTGTDSCTRLSPCKRIAKALATNRPYVKLHGVTDEAVSIAGGRVVTFLADPNAKLTRSSGNGAIVTVQDDKTSLSVYDLSIGDAPNNASGIGFIIIPTGIPTGSGPPTLLLTRVKVTNNPGGGISNSGGSLTVLQSTISGNGGAGISTSGGSLTVTRSTIEENHGGGVMMSGAGTVFTITDNFIYRNGNASSVLAGGISVVAAGISKLERNTIVDNQSTVSTTSAGGVVCNDVGFVAAHNLIFRNMGGPSGSVQTIGLCGYGDSLILAGASNVDNSLGFARPNAAPFDYHLTATSPATVVDAAGACTGVDFDGEARPGGRACDLGADEYRP